MEMRGGLAASSSGTDSRALGLVKELERRVEALDDEALDETTEAEVDSNMSHLLFRAELIYNDRNLHPLLHIIPRRSSRQFTKTF
jgi:hypothetical protein